MCTLDFSNVLYLKQPKPIMPTSLCWSWEGKRSHNIRTVQKQMHKVKINSRENSPRQRFNLSCVIGCQSATPSSCWSTTEPMPSVTNQYLGFLSVFAGSHFHLGRTRIYSVFNLCGNMPNHHMFLCYVNIPNVLTHMICKWILNRSSYMHIVVWLIYACILEKY